MESLSSNTRTCRACLQGLLVKGRRKPIKLSDLMRGLDANAKLTYLQAFESCSGFRVDSSDPQYICDKCASELLIAFQFKEKCKETQHELWNLLEKCVQPMVQPLVKIEHVEVKIEEDEEEIKTEDMADAHYEEDNSVSEEEEKESLGTNNRISCDLCRKRYRSRAYVLQHCNQKHKDERRHECPHCNQKQFLQFLDFHMKRCSKREKESSRDKKSLCPICGELMPQYHIKWHAEKEQTAQNPFICDICGNKLYTKSGVIMHMQTQHLKILINCRHCPEKFRTRQLLDTHLRLCHPDVKSLLKCKLCDYTTIYTPNMRTHKKNHAGKRPHKCNVCHREFNEPNKLKNHMATHSDARPFACEVCGATFKIRKTLNVHRKIHQGHDYECPVCQRTFSSNQLMLQHVKRKHPEYQLPPPGTVMNRSYRMKMAEKKLKEEALRQGVDMKVVESIVVTEPPPLEEMQIFKRHTALSGNIE